MDDEERRSLAGKSWVANRSGKILVGTSRDAPHTLHHCNCSSTSCPPYVHAKEKAIDRKTIPAEDNVGQHDALLGSPILTKDGATKQVADVV